LRGRCAVPLRGTLGPRNADRDRLLVGGLLQEGVTMGEDESPECIRVVKAVLLEYEAFDSRWFNELGGYSALGMLHTLELLWRDLHSQKESMQRAAQQRNVADAPAQNDASCTCLYPLQLVCVVDCDCPIHGTHHSKSAGHG
jgi:hypothetical protein